MLGTGFYVYIVTNRRNGTLYTGHSEDLLMRATQHRDGTFKGFTYKYDCKHLVWFEEHPSRDSAFKRERKIKKWNRDWKLKLIEDMNPHWIDIGLSPVWPIPNAEDFPDLYQKCLTFALER